MMSKLGVEVKIDDIKKIEAERKEREGMVVVRVDSEEERKEILRNKWRLRGETVWIEEDITWEERKIR